MPAAEKLDIRQVYPLKHGRPSRLQQAVRALIEVALEQNEPFKFIDCAIGELEDACSRV